MNLKKIFYGILEFFFEDKPVTDYIVDVIKRFDNPEYNNMSGQEKFESVLISVRNDATNRIRDRVNQMTTDEQRLLIQKAVVKVREMK